MQLKSALLGAALAVLPALASAHMVIEDAYARAASPLAQTAAIYMSVRNHSDADDRMFRVESDAADRVEIHTHVQSDDGVMRMVELEDGISIPGGATHTLQPGGDHIMLLGLSEPLEQGDTFEMLVFFDVWVPMIVTVTVDNEAVNAMVGHGDGDGGIDMDGDAGADHSGHGSSDG
ncbi:copper chaperone PCu(A)C [Hasllibacter sp. MH4015]|uniref:copper chaperone PCu(A)C n=1 Tax=Hasllibacter sp. MH4015 TaxID=2854029 RepID=UPI001CD6D9E7|nr:copper chaperone PCu(A)C [Hasllibacter sp. MH4015]